MKKILIADDIKSRIDGERSLFKRSDIKIFTSLSNKETLRIHKTENVDLIIAHFEDRELNGEALCDLIRKDPELCRVSIILINPYGEADIRGKSSFKANVYISEPILPAFLFEKSHQLLNIAQREFFRAPIIVKVKGEQKNEAFFCLSENISASGMLFGTDRILKQGDTIICSFILPGSTRIMVESEIVRVVGKKGDVDTNQYGIRFMSLDAAAKAAIEMFVQENLRANQ